MGSFTDLLALAAQHLALAAQHLALAAQHLALDKAAARVDLGCGCPANIVTGHGTGSSLLRSLQLVHDWVRAMVEAAGQHCMEAGAAFITMHARTKVQKYEGRADRALIARARQLLHIPVAWIDLLLFLHLLDSLRSGAAEQQAGQQRWDEPELVQAFLRRFAAEACHPCPAVLSGQVR
ncbi:hypothetical protein V8C86DRAFT_3138515 [Haematococcus lacustris]